MATARTIINDARDRLGDAQGDRWKDPFCLNALNYGLKEYARRTKSFRKLAAISTGQDPERFELPPDTVEVYFVEYDGTVLSATSWRELEAMDATFTSQTGTPLRWYQDITDITQLRIWPIPTDNDEDLATILLAAENGGGNANDSDAGEGGVIYALFDAVAATFDVPALSGANGNDTAANQGCVVYIDDSLDTRTFEFIGKKASPFSPERADVDQGEIVTMFASKVRIGYSYVPEAIADMDQDIVLPDPLEEGLVHFVMVRAYERDGMTRDLDKAKYFRGMFEEVVEEATRRATEGFMSRVREVEGNWV